MAEKLLLVDAPNHAFRAYHAIQTDMRAPDGFPTRALYGFTRVLLNLIRDQRPDYVALVFDVGNSFRNALFPAYKGQRPDMPEDLRQQWGEFGPLCEAFGFHVIAEPNTEADDVIGTLAVRFASPALEVGIVSSDKDFGQLVNEHIYVLDLMKNLRVGPDQVRERWGVGPERIIDLLALMGDASDNVPGVPGVGEKKAAQFIQRFGDLEGVLANGAAIGGKTGQAVTESAELVRLARVLVTIDIQIPVQTTLETLRPRPRNDAELIARLSRYNFRSLMQELKLDVPAVANPASITPASEIELTTVWGPAPLAALSETLRAAARVVVHVERVEDRPARVFFAWKANRDVGAMVPVDAASLPWIQATLADPTIAKTGFDLKTVARQLGPVSGVVGDALIADYLRSPEQKRGLAEVCERQLGREVGVAWGDGVRTVLQLDRTLDGVLAAWNATRVYTEIELPILPILARMEAVGIAVTRPAFATLAAELDGRLQVLEKVVHAAAGEPFLIGSTQQLAHILYEKLGLKGAKKTKTGWSTDADTLDKLRDQHPLPGAVLAWRELTKLKNTYVDALPTTIAADGRIHTHYDQAVAATGRLFLLGARPPEHPHPHRRRTADPGLLRRVPGDALRQRRLLPDRAAGARALLRRRPARRELPQRGGHPSTDRVRDLRRRPAVGVLRATPRGQGDQLWHRVRDGGVPPRERSADPPCTRPVLHRWVLRTLSAGPGLHGRRLRAGARGGVQRDPLRSPAAVPGLDAGNQMDRAAAERIAINSPIQGTAADIIKCAMIRVDRAVAGTGARLLLQVHDELVLEVPEGEVETARARVKAEMEAVVALAVPLVVDTGTGATWGAAH